MTEPNISVGFTARVLGAEGPVAKGNALIYDPTTALDDGTLGVWRVATTANRTSANVGADAIALTAYGGSVVGTVSYQAAGVVATEISGLPPLTPSPANKLVRVSATGSLERIDAYTSGDDVVGYARWNGRVALHIGLPWSLIAQLGGIAALPDKSLQRRNPDGTFGGLAHANGSDDGYVELRSADADVVPGIGTGYIRVPYVDFTFLVAKDSADTLNRAIISHSTGGGWVFGNLFGGVTNLVGTGVVIQSGGGALYSATQHSFATPGGEIMRLDSADFYSGVPRYGLNTAWGSSEGKSTVSATGPHTLTTAEHPYASQIFSGAGTGTYTYPAPTDARTYFKWLTETGGFDKTITTGSVATYALKANSHAYVKFTSTGVFGLSDSASGGAFSFSGSLTDDATDFYLANGGILVAALSSMAVPVAYLGCPTPSGGMVAKQLKVGLPVALASGETCTVTLLKNGSATAITKVIAHSDVMPVVITGSVSYSETDAWDVIANASSTDGAFPVQATLTWGPP